MSDNVSLRIVTLAHGHRSEEDLQLVTGLDTTVNELKHMIHQSLPQRPNPSRQRLIYQGRGLSDESVALRNILRIDPRASADNASHVIHLVIRDTNVANAPSTTSTTTNQTANLSQNGMQPQNPSSWQQTHVHLPPALGQAEQLRLHNQLHNLQHQLHHNQAHNRAMAQAMPARQQPVNTTPAPIQAATPLPNGPAIRGPAENQAQEVRPTMRVIEERFGPAMMRIEEVMGPDGQRFLERREERADGSTFITTLRETPRVIATTNLNTPDPNVRPSSAPGASPPAESDPVQRAANPPLAPHVHLHTPRPQVPMAFPFPPPMQMPMPIPMPFPGMAHHLPHAAPVNMPSIQPVAWLLSSPQGPQGIVFAPGQGFFSTTAPTTNVTSQAQESTSNLQPTPTTAVNTSQPAQTAAPPQAQLVLHPQNGHAEARATQIPQQPQPGARAQAGAPNQGLVQPNVGGIAQQARQQIQNNDLVAFFIERTWLFIRLYVFVFIFSEYGSWRRLLMLTSAIVFCLLPRENPFSNMLQAARRHFDNLIGPPNITQQQGRAEGQGQGQNQNAARDTYQAQGETGSSRQSQPQRTIPTPEEAARRLLEQQNRHNPNPVINVLYRFEQGIALFLASLVPGLGERHVQAREQARRILEEEERRTQEEREQQAGQDDAQASSESTKENSTDEHKQAGPLPENWASPGNGSNSEATSSGVDTGGRSDLRARGTGS